MNFDPTLAALVSEMPKGLLSLMEREQGASKNVAHGGLPRRAFLKVGVVSGFALGAFPLTTLAQAGAAPGAPVALKPFEQPSAFVRIATDGTVTVTVNRLEFGQGVLTALPMILAEELDADWSQVRAVHGDADPA